MKVFSVALPNVILPLMISGLFFISAIAAIGRPQFATGPQKCCADINNEKIYTLVISSSHRIDV